MTEDKDKLKDLELRINHTILNIQNSPPEKTKFYQQRLSQYAKQYKEMTGRPFQVTFNYELE